MKTTRLHRMLLLFLAISALTVLSCSKEKLVQEDEISTLPAQEQTDEPEEPGEEGDEEGQIQEESEPYVGELVSLTFTAEAPSKTTLAADGHTVNWVAGDEVRFDGYYTDGDTKTLVHRETTAKSTGHATAFVPIDVPANLQPYMYVTYPTSAFSWHSTAPTPKRIRFNFPSEPTASSFADVDYSLAKTTRTAGVWNTSLTFYNVAAILKIGITDPDITSIVVSSEGGEYIAGKLECGINDDGELFDKGSLEDNTGSSTITLDIDGAGTYYIAAVPCTLSTGFRVTPYKGEVAQTPFWYPGEYILERGKITKLGSVDTHAGQYYVSVSGAGNKTGQNFANAMDIGQFKAMVALQNTNDGAAAQAALIGGATFHFSAEEFNFEEMLGFGFQGLGSAVPITFEGSIAGRDKTTFTGDDDHRIIDISTAWVNLSITNINFTNSKGAGGGQAAIRLANGSSSLSLTGCRFSDNNNTSTGGGIHVGNGTLNVNNCSFDGNNVNGGDGSGINIDGQGNITLTNCEFTSNNKPVLRINRCSSFAASGLVFEGNAASCIRVLNNYSMNFLTFTNCTFTDNSSTGGAVLYLMGGSTVTFNGTTTMTGNHASNSGGAIAIRNTSSDTEITGTGSVAITGNCTIDGCYSTGTPGGAIYANTTGTVNVSGATIENCYTSGYNGGAVGLKGGVRATFEDTSFESNSTDENGGAICADVCTLTLNGCSFTSNTAECNTNDYGGGAIFLTGEGATVIIDDCDFTENEATNKCGGAISAPRSSESNSVTIRNGCTFTDNYAKGWGGAILFKATGSLTVSDCTFSGNYAGGDSGAINTDVADFTFTRVTFSGNHADGDKGGVMWADGSTYSFTSCVFDDNYSDGYYGGAIYSNSAGSFKFNKCFFDGNHGTEGGAIFANKSAVLYLNDCVFTGNYITATYGTTLSVNNGSELCMNNCTFADNTYTTVGDASGDARCWIYVAHSTLVMSNSSLIGYNRRGSGGSNTGGGTALVIFDIGSGKSTTASFINNIIAFGKTGNFYGVKKIGSGTLSATFVSNKDSGYMSFSPSTSGTEGNDFFGLSTYFGGLSYFSPSSPTVPSWNNCYWSWNGTLSTGTNTSKDTKANIISAINTADSDFKTWLETSGVDGLSKDGRGNTRPSSNSDTWWPGAYQN